MSQTPPPDEPVSSQTVKNAEDRTPGEEITTGEAMLLKLKQGGITMIFLLVVSVIAVASTLERAVHLRLGKIAPHREAEEMKKLCRDGRFNDLGAAADASHSTLGRVVTTMVRHRGQGLEAISALAGDVASREMKLHLLRAYPLMVCATISPLLGLFGTVAGMIGAFDKVAAAGSLGDASMLGGDISKALITTAAGLVVAIPSLGFYHFFRSRTSLMSIALEEQIGEMLSLWRNEHGKDSEREA